MKLRLSRRVVPSARVNLNSYWNNFEELANQNLPLVNFGTSNTCELITTTMRQLEMNPVEENQLNEQLESGNKWFILSFMLVFSYKF